MTGPRSAALGAAVLVMAATLWGCWSIVFRSAEAASQSPLPASRETAVVFVVMLLTMAPMALFSRRHQVNKAVASGDPAPPPRDRKAWSILLLLGVTDALNALFFFQAMQKTTVAIAVLCHYLTPVIVAALSPLVLKEPRRASTWVALGVALTGLVLLLQPWTEVRADDIVGAALAATSAVFYAATVFIGKGAFARFSALEVGAWSKLTSVAVLVVAAVVVSGGIAVELPALAILVAGGVVCGTVPTVLFYAGLQRLQASHASVLTLMEPLVAVVVGVLVWGEALTGLGVLGGALVLCGAVIIARASSTTSSPVPSPI